MIEQSMRVAPMEFHVSRRARDRYQFDEMLFSLTGRVIFANFHAARLFAQKMNDRRDLVNFPEQAVRAGQINAMGLIDEVLHRIIAIYKEQNNPNIMRDALQWLQTEFSPEAVDRTLHRFVDEFPPITVYRRELSVDEYLAGVTNNIPNRESAMEEMLMLWLANMNPAFAPFRELFDDSDLSRDTIYAQAFPRLHQFFEAQPRRAGARGTADSTGGVTGTEQELAGRLSQQNLIDLLRTPALASPHSLEGQLQFLQQRYGMVIGRLLYRVLSSVDLIREEEKPIFAGGGPGPVEIPAFAGLESEPERFSPDLDWMPRVVMIARNAYVWLDQLTKRYGRPIATLGDIPDDELDTLAHRGITGLWLIGLWERSVASKTIKQLMGNPEAVASAYSLFDYTIAADLGGEQAYQILRDRAWQRGIRLASDMVPNHMGIDSHWVLDHPDWFIGLDHPPFPAYSFNGPDLSPDPNIGIYLEDHYFDRSDAAVVFKRVDRRGGQEHYIYHGNDGTSMPWNDTAQLNYLLPHVREAVIQTILHVARMFPIIRFDAAMTLAKRHIQRLWFPEPGSGGAIASRADYGMTKAQFDAMIPIEFWREVVDRAAVEAPDTLLLAEAFWLMEGYFVRTLGMHRVYNSAFMNLLRDEDNAKYRTVMKNTLEFDPEILKRYVNFMSNPDERTAVDQFGKGDKYFGVCTLMATMPGLPMLGHAQVEGFAEKYGMEYRRAYWDEQPDQHLIDRHEREIFPLFHRRHLFSGVEHFLLYDFQSADGGLNEDVFAYSNRTGDERSLVVYHNRYGTARGRIQQSVAFSARTGDERSLVRRSLAEGLGLHAEDDWYCIYRDQRSGLEYIRGSRELAERGLELELGAYQCHVFLDIREVRDNEWHQYGNLASFLGGRGVPSVEEAMREIFLQPVHQPYRELVNATVFRRLFDERAADAQSQPDPGLLREVDGKVLRLLREVKQFAGDSGDEQVIAREIRGKLEVLLELPRHGQVAAEPEESEAATVEQATGSHLKESEGDTVELPEITPLDYVLASLSDDPARWGTLFSWLFTHALGKVAGESDWEQQSRSWIDEWLLHRVIATTLGDLGADQGAAAQAVTAVRILTSNHDWASSAEALAGDVCPLLEGWLKDSAVQQFIGVNRYQDVLWYNQEAFEQLLGYLASVAAVEALAAAEGNASVAAEQIAAAYALIEALQAASAASEYKLDQLLEAARQPSSAAPTTAGATGSGTGQAVTEELEVS